MTSQYDFYIIKSNQSLTNIKNFLLTKTEDRSDIGPIKKIFTRDKNTKVYKNTAFRYIILRKSFYDNLIENGYGEDGDETNEFEIVPHFIKDEDYAHPRSSVMHFYYPLNKEKDNNESIRKRLDMLSKYDLIKKESYMIHEKEGVCEFSNDITFQMRTQIKMMLDSHEEFRVSWCRKGLFNNVNRRFAD